jgi:hypothetical protein
LLPILRELGIRQVALYAAYRLGLRLGYFRRACDPEKALRTAEAMSTQGAQPLWSPPSKDELLRALSRQDQDQLIQQADEIVAGKVRLFGGPPGALQLNPPEPLEHWARYEKGQIPAAPAGAFDIKWIWEPGRLGWAYTLGRAYLLSQDERYATAYWCFIGAFLQANPPYQGPHWASAQEVAIRLIALTFGRQIFGISDKASAAQKARLIQAVAIHAARIPPTLIYAQAQNNNHLLTEAAGLYTAGLFLPAHPQAKHWRELGWRWFNRGVLAQVSPDGAYVQHSTNYHRLMLQTALWMNYLAQSQGQPLPGETLRRLSAATRWLQALVDPISGRVPNLGPNDGAYILPLTACPQEDYRPVLQAAGRAFLGEQPFAPGLWDEMSLWFGAGRSDGSSPRSTGQKRRGSGETPHVLRSPDGASWAYLRAVRFSGRPGHADQLHLDLWWHGLNVAQDAGTYLYNASPPWDNALARSEVHNTLIIDGQDQMRRAGRFLFVDWAQAQVLKQERWQDGSLRCLSARHNGYRRLGLWHQRDIRVGATGNWEIIDTVYPMKPASTDRSHTVCLHWLLPDWPWQVLANNPGAWGYDVMLDSPLGQVRLHMERDQAGEAHLSESFQIVRAGELLHGSGAVSPVWGWFSPTYGVKTPALSVRYTVVQRSPIRLTSEFIFPPSPGAEKV